jgi:demethylmenaquinone methyltransferase / 2-methoxy-6-polyprenyl-1,4-benzoquinol methylase
MANPYLVPGAQQAARVNDLFGVIAARYDLINDLQSFGLHRLWKRRLLRMARLGPGDRALDLCCGTGDLALRMARNGTRVIGVDFSPAMLAVAAERAQARRQRHPRESQPSKEPATPSFIRADALRIPFGDAQFDAVTIGYGLRNLASVEDGLREMQRVAKPGGRLLVLDFGNPAHPLWRGLFHGYLRGWVPVFGKVFCGDADAYRYILSSLQRYPAQEGVAAILRALDCRNVRVVNLLGGVMSIHYCERGW